MLNSKSTNAIITTLLAAALLIGTTVYLMNASKNEAPKSVHFTGRPLPSYNEFYPIRLDADGRLQLDKDRFMAAVAYFSKNPSPKAIADLIYLGQSNNIMLSLNDEEKLAYRALLSQPDYASVVDSEKNRDRILQVYKDVVDGIGETFAGTGIEIVLHDTRNPIHSVVAIQNPISGRRLGDTNTNFGLELIKNYSDINRQSGNFVSYGLTLKDGRKIKSTTIPLFDQDYGLVGFICMNLDTSKLDKEHPEEVERFIERFRLVRENSRITELIENSKIRR